MVNLAKRHHGGNKNGEIVLLAAAESQLDLYTNTPKRRRLRKERRPSSSRSSVEHLTPYLLVHRNLELTSRSRMRKGREREFFSVFVWIFQMHYLLGDPNCN